MEDINQLIITRLFKEDIHLIEEIQKVDTENFEKFKSHYPNHKIWLTKILQEIKEGKKIAFVAYLPVKSSKSISYNGSFVGSVIFKKGISGEAEIKNLLTHKENLKQRFDNKDDLIDASTKIKAGLVEKVENFCIQRGYKKLHYEVPSSDTDDINFLLSQEFKLLSTIESKYKKNDYFYIFSKDLINSYNGDPYNYIEIGRRLLTDFFQFDNTEGPSEFILEERDSELYKLKFSLDTINDDTTSLALSGELIIAIPDAKDEKIDFNSVKKRFSNDVNIKIALTDYNTHNEENSAVKSISLSDLEKVFKFKRTLISKFYKINEIKSLLINVDIENNAKILQNKKQDLVAFTFDGIGDHLNKIRDIRNDDIFVFLYSSPSKSNPEGGVWATCKFVLNYTDKSDEIYSFYKKEKKFKILIDESLYNYNASYNDNTNVIAFELKVEAISKKPIDIEDCLTEETKYVIKQTDFEFGIPNTYLDQTSTNQILKKIKNIATKNREKSSTKQQKEVTTKSKKSEAIKSEKKNIKEIKIFLASSLELKEDRSQFEIFINRENKKIIKKGFFIHLIMWEDFIDAMSKTALQDEYNKSVVSSDIFISLFFTKVGKYTSKEFEIAFGKFKKTGKPHIYTYFKNSQVDIQNVGKDFTTRLNFINQLKKLGHFPTFYRNVEDLKNHFKEQLYKLYNF